MSKITQRISVFVLVLVSIFNANAQQKTATKLLYTKIDTYLSNGAKNGFSGAISVVKNGEIVINKGYGIANKKTTSLNNPNTLFDIGSNTKQFTATAILKLVELGKLQLTAPISTFFKELPLDKQGITIHQLLSHTAGFIDALGRDFTEITEKDYFEQLFSSKLIATPGEKYNYSNAGYSTLGRIIEIVSHKPYESFVNEQLFKPAGMFQTGYLLPKWDATQISHSYNRGIIDRESPITRYQKDGVVNWHLKANGGMNSTQNDMLLWHKALKTNKILSKASFKKLTTDHMSGYGYGWGVKTSKNHGKRISHNGSNGAYAHSIIWYPKEDLYIVYVTNANSSKVEYLGYAIAKILLNENHVPTPIQNNIFSFIYNYTEQYTPNTSQKLLTILTEKYSSDFTHAGVLNTLGNLLLRANKNLDWALELFKLNVQRYPKDGNLWDSLADGYLANNLKSDAKKSYQKAIKLGYNGSTEKLKKLK